jgi:hypothetical protein
MSHERTTREAWGRRAAAAGLALAAGLTWVAPALAELPAYGMMTVARTETAVLYAVLTHQPSAQHPGCRLTASFVDAQGKTLRDRAGRLIKASWVLRGNVAASLPLRAADVLASTQSRRLVRAAVREDLAGGASNCCALTLTLEISDAFGGIGRLHKPRVPNPPSPICLEP